jgi:hypothetical protein
MHAYSRTWMVYRNPFDGSEVPESTVDRHFQPFATANMSKTVSMNDLETPQKSGHHSKGPIHGTSQPQSSTVGPSVNRKSRRQTTNPCEWMS